MSQDVPDLLARISGNFPIRPVPIDIGRSTEAPQVNAYFNGREWPTITVQGLLTEGKDKDGWGDVPAYPFFMNDEGYRYYLPAYMRMILAEMNDENGWLLETIISGLHKNHYQYTLQKEDGSLVRVDNFAQRFSPFSSEQKRDIADFLYHQIKHYGPKPVNYVRDNVLDVYESYWHQFASDKTAQE